MTFYFKIIGSLFFVASTTFMGFACSNKLKTRKEFLMTFLDFLCNLQANIRYCCEDIYSLINKSVTNEYLNMFHSTENLPFNEYWKNSVDNIPTSYGLTQEDFTLIKDFGAVLGVTDVEGQTSHIELYRTLFDSQLKKAETQQKTKSKLYKVLGFFAGSVMVLMII